ncbi:MAG: DUF115 domain-containing protein [Spirochaetes bacterium]|nr:DUF115 domain-containing protein [Spirochaetota bacterium]
MDLHHFENKNGFLSVSINNTRIHSQYDPEKEALRFIKTKLNTGISFRPSTIIILGAGLGYLVNAVKVISPGTRIITVYYSQPLYENSFASGTVSWHDKLNISLPDFLKNNIGELDTEGLITIEWPPCARAFSGLSNYVNRVVYQFINELTGNLRTTLYTGKRWIKNTFNNFLHHVPDFKLKTGKTHTPVIIAASGPSLHKTAPMLKKFRNSYILLALPSSLLFLDSINLKPDLVVVTDPNFYSFYHFANYKNTGLHIIMPFSAPTGMHNLRHHVSFFCQPYFFEHEIVKESGLYFMNIVPKGTVAATALELALNLTDREIIFAGLDLCYFDIKSHVQPNSFDFYYYSSSDRYHPLYTEIFSFAMQRAPHTKLDNGVKYRFSDALRTYTGSFNISSCHADDNVYRIFPSPVKITGINNITLQTLKGIMQKTHFHDFYESINPKTDYPDFKKRKQVLLTVIDNWLKSVQNTRSNLQSTGDPGVLINDARFLNLSYYIDPQLLIEIKRKARLHGTKPAMDTALLLCKNEYYFLNNLRKTIKEAETDET